MATLKQLEHFAQSTYGLDSNANTIAVLRLITRDIPDIKIENISDNNFTVWGDHFNRVPKTSVEATKEKPATVFIISNTETWRVDLP